MTDKLTGAAGRQYVADAIRHALRSGDLVPGQRLVENDLAESYGATRGAVREALQDLAAEEILEIVPRRGARVRMVSVEEAIQITECRSALEQLCARKAATLATDAQRGELDRIGADMRQAVADGAWDAYSALNQRLHELVIEASGQEVARRTLDRLNGPMVRFQFRLALRPGRPARSLPQHLAIIEAVVGGDAAAAAEAAAAHLDDVIEQLRSPAASART
ncbi:MULTISPECIES: GntR family transcriptional regulator [Streptomyces]|uniref:GntR family transcriptional regulator n=4 Tax=Streptomyces TaxID=1883 RepID=A0A8H9HM84_9ACTN|nr:MULTISPECIES: GntR family transcriptional regulator [Streptomyces]NEC14322.1 GntR family transcriptional regulator [Streptomyces sp. SID8014]NEE28288.1 GntR family transcriptional regulator [Streptomyces sp. SID7982]NEE59256.1 GntR family transcriptional regulator [Streptomyces sp. SID8455]MBL3808075.1 GntR family transcriptional regulator [Streptomyces sp. BRB081]MDQ0297229.1 DNA-binding GntR family transcriptional regulator [Streptomyces sp. DSM 41037]